MPWRGPEYVGEFPSLGWDVLDWAGKHLRVPFGPHAGTPLVLTDEQVAIVVRFYGLDTRGRWLFRRASVRRAKGWGKSPLLAVIALAELCGPSRFGGWDGRGEPVAVMPKAPWVQIAACSEDQTDNTYSALYAMISESELADHTVNVGLTRVYLRNGIGRLEPVTASVGSREGQPITFAVLDETHLWTKRNGGHKLAATLRRNARKGRARTFESTNAPVLGEDSVAEQTHKAWENGTEGLLYDAVEAPYVEDLADSAAVLEALKVAYGDSTWVPLDEIVLEIADPASDPQDVRRFWFNQLTSGGECPFDMHAFDECAWKYRDVPKGSRIGIGFDGSDSDDTTAIYGCTDDFHLFLIGAWRRPPGVEGWRVPRLEVDEVLRDAFAKYRVRGMLADPPGWRTEIETWQARWGDRVLALDTNQPRRFAPECDRFATTIREKALSHDGNQHLRAALAATKKVLVRLADEEDDARAAWRIDKADTRKIDDAVAAILALGASPKQPKSRLISMADVLARLDDEGGQDA